MTYRCYFEEDFAVEADIVCYAEEGGLDVMDVMAVYVEGHEIPLEHVPEKLIRKIKIQAQNHDWVPDWNSK